MAHVRPRHLDTRLFVSAAICLGSLCGPAARAQADEEAFAAGGVSSSAAAESRRVQDLVDWLRQGLAVSHEVTVTSE